MSDEVEVFTFLTTEQTVDGVDEDVDDVDVLPLVETTYIICICHLAFMEDKIDSTGVILYVQPVANIQAFAINRQWFAMANVVDEEWDELLWELVRTIVVGAVGHDGRHAVCVVESAYEVVAACLCGRVWRVGVILGGLKEELCAVSMVVSRRCFCCERRLNTFRVCKFERTINLICRDMVEALALVLLRKALPIYLRSLKQRQCAHHVSACEGERILNRAVYVALCSKVDNAVNLVLLHEFENHLEVADVALNECVILLVLDILQVGKIACICKFVKVYYVILWILVDKKSNNM